MEKLRLTFWTTQYKSQIQIRRAQANLKKKKKGLNIWIYVCMYMKVAQWCPTL